jgi:hypothetical protein
MARPAQSLKVGVIIGSAMTLRFDMVNRGRGYGSTFTQAGLAKVLITIKYSLTNEGPLATVATFVAALALLVVLPTSIAVLIAIAAAVNSGIATTMFATSSRYSRWHRDSNKKDHHRWPSSMIQCLMR